MKLTSPKQVQDHKSKVEELFGLIELQFEKDPIMDEPHDHEPRRRKSIRVPKDFTSRECTFACKKYEEAGWELVEYDTSPKSHILFKFYKD